MMRLRRPSRLIALAALAGMLFLQAALAFAACNLRGEAASAMPMATMESDSSDCHEADASKPLCLTHCQGDDQAFAKPQAILPDLPVAPLLQVATWQSAPVAERVPVYAPRVAPGPPRRILFQSFLL